MCFFVFVLLRCWFVLLRVRVCVGVVLVGLVGALCVFVSPAQAGEAFTPVVGSFNVGGGLVGGVDSRTGKFSTQFPLVDLPGVLGVGGVQMGLVYSQDLVTSVGDRFGFGAGWGLGVPFVDVDNGARFFPVSGGMFQVDGSQRSGLARYLLEDVVFQQVSGVVCGGVDGFGVTRVGDVLQGDGSGGSECVGYGFVLDTGGGKEFFDGVGNLVARVGVFGEFSRWVWGAGHRLESVVDGGGNTVRFVWSELGVQVVSDRGSGGVSSEFLGLVGGFLCSVTDGVGGVTVFGYGVEGVGLGLLSRVVSPVGAVTQVSYQRVVGGVVGVDHVRVVDGVSGEVVLFRSWRVVGEHTAQGWPVYAGEGVLWGSGDGAYRYVTEVSDGVTRVVSQFTALGLMVERRFVLSAPVGDVVARVEGWVFPVPAGGYDSGLLPAQYGLPVRSFVVFQDGLGRSRTVGEEFEYDRLGRVVKRVGVDGVVVVTVYDREVPVGGGLGVGLVLEETTTGVDGQVSRVVNTLTGDHRAVGVEEKFVGSGSGVVSVSRSEFVVGGDGFVLEKRVVGPGGSEASGSGGLVGDVVTRFDRRVEGGVVVVEETDGVGSGAQSSTVRVFDKRTGLVVSVTDAVGRVMSTTYDVLGRKVVERGFSGLVTRTEYGGLVTRVSAPSGVVRSEYRDVIGRVVKVTDNIFLVGEDSSTAVVGGGERVVESRRYEQNSSRVVVVDGEGLESVTVLDVFSRPVSVTAPGGVTQVKEYDDVGNTVRSGVTSLPGRGLVGALQVRTEGMDERGRVTSVSGSRSDGVGVGEETTVFDGLGRVTGGLRDDVVTRVSVNPDGTSRSTSMVPVGEGGGEQITAEREHNFLGVPVKKTLVQGDKRSEGVRRGVDVAGRVVLEEDQGGGVTRYGYTCDGLVSVVWYSDGVVKRYVYDPVSRKVVGEETVSAGGDVVRVSREYDAVTGDLLVVFDPADRVGSQVVYRYDVLGNVVEVLYPDGKVVGHRFDGFGRELSSTDVVGVVTSFSYDGFGVLVGVVQVGVGGVVIGRVGYGYDGFGRVVEVRRGDGVVTSYSYTSVGEVEREVTVDGGGGLVFRGVYSYDGLGNLVERVESRPGVGGGEVSEVRVFSYDGFNRLVGSSVFEGVDRGRLVSCVGYEVNVSGDVVRETTTTGVGGTVVREFEYNSLGFLVGVVTGGVRVEQVFDGAGNLVRGVDGTVYSYGVDNRVVREVGVGGVVVDYLYWVTGQRRGVVTTVPGGDPTVAASPTGGVDAGTDLTSTVIAGVPTTATPTATATATVPTPSTESPIEGVAVDSSATSVGGVSDVVGLYWDGDVLVNDIHTVGGVCDAVSYLVGLSRHTRSVNGGVGGTEYYVTDRHGSTVALVGAGGGVSVWYSYTDYGVPTVYVGGSGFGGGSGGVLVGEGSGRNPFQYSGGYTTVTGRQLLGGRVYDPGVMRFTSRDSAEVYNLYAYGNLNPITMVDPTGHNSVEDYSQLQTMFICTFPAVAFFGGLCTPVIMAPVSFGAGALAWASLISSVVLCVLVVVVSKQGTFQIAPNVTVQGSLSKETTSLLTKVTAGLFGFFLVSAFACRGVQRSTAYGIMQSRKAAIQTERTALQKNIATKRGISGKLTNIRVERNANVEYMRRGGTFETETGGKGNLVASDKNLFGTIKDQIQYDLDDLTQRHSNLSTAIAGNRQAITTSVAEYNDAQVKYSDSSWFSLLHLPSPQVPLDANDIINSVELELTNVV